MSANTWKLIAIIAVLLFSFIVAFQPIGRPPTEVISTFRVHFEKPIAEKGADVAKLVDEIKKALVDAGMAEDNIDQIRLISDREIEISTLALNQQQADEDKATIEKAMRAHFKDNPFTIGYPPGVAQQRQPIFKIGHSIAIYKPVPRVNLGLDLQGGAHVVLRCLPYARMLITVPEDKPLVEPQAEAAKAKIRPDWKPTLSKDAIERRITRALVDAGTDPKDIKVQLISPTMLQVETHPVNERQLKRQQQAVVNAIRQAYPGYSPEDIKVEIPEKIFLERGIADKVKTIIDRRLYAMSEIREPVIQRQGEDRIIVELPGVRDPERVLKILKSTAMLKFLLIPARYKPAAPETDEYDEWQDSTTGQTVPWERVMAESKVVFTGRDLQSNASVGPSGRGDWVVHFELKPKKKREFYNFTRRNVGRLMAIVLDDKCVMAPEIKEPIPGRGIIEGRFTADEARDLKLLLNAGALPVPLEIAENRTVSPTLGRDSVIRSLRAGLIGLLAVALFMILYYRLPGLVADLALLIYVLLVLAILVVAKVTLTLPGIAGIILSIGMAVDANILIFERLKEELWSGKNMRAAVEAGFSRAWTAILDANVTTLISCAVLYFLGTSAIKTFAVTLTIGVVCSLFTAVTVTHWMLDIVGATGLGRRPELYGIAPRPAPEPASQ